MAQRGIRLSDELTLDVYRRAVTIRGRVDSYYQRQLLIHSIRLVPGISGIFLYYRTSLFCRNLGVLLGSGVNLTATLRILVDIMSGAGRERPL